jgi:hypothetical protein
MKATELLEKQHDEVQSLFKKLEDADEAEQKEIFEELARSLVAHDAIERQIFYPACEKALGMTDLLGESLVEHGVVEFMLYEADQALGKDDFKFKWTVLQEALEHHIEEEESDLFPDVEKSIDEEELESLGEKMEEAFDEASKEDFRAPLHRNLKQVLAGAIKPSPAKGNGGSRRKPPTRHSGHSRASR